MLSPTHSKKSRATQPEYDNDLLENEEPPGEASDAEIDLLDEPMPDEHLTAAKRGAYAEHLGCEPTSVAVVESLHERMKWTIKVACRSLLTLANSLGLDVSDYVSTALLI